MKILYINKFFYHKGGAETVMFQERAAMAARGHEILDFSMSDPQNYASKYSEYFVSPKAYRKGTLKLKARSALSFIHSGEAVERLTGLVKKYRPEVAHLHNIYHQLTPSIIPALKKLGVKVVLTAHDAKLICPSYLMLNKGTPCTACNGRHFYKAITKHCCNSLAHETLLAMEAYYHRWKGSYDHVDICVSPSRFLSGLLAVRLPQERLRVLHNGIEVNKYKPTWEDENYILFMGRLSHEKGVRTLIRAHAAMPKPPKLVIMGTGPIEAELHSIAGKNVTFTGYCQGEQLWDYVRKASCLILPSQCYENCPMTSLEAMAMGKPVIGSNMGGIPEQLENNVTGILCEALAPEDFTQAMRRIMDSRELRLQMGKMGRLRVEKLYSLDSHIEQLEEIYKQLLHTGGQ